jgi:hypothetical protein
MISAGEPKERNPHHARSFEMRNYSLSITLALAIALSCWPAAFAQTPPPSKAAPAAAPRHTPDFSGVWMQDHAPATALDYWVYEFSPQEPPMTAWGLAQYKAAKPSFGAHAYPLEQTNDPIYHSCIPPGMPRIFLHPLPMEIVQGPSEVVMLFEYDSIRRQIYTDGRAHDTSLGPLWMGDSIGHWEGDTLVVDTVNLNDKNWIDRVGHPHSEALHVVERIRRVNHDHLLDELTIEDPKAYTKPWTAHMDFLLRPKWTLGEQFCEDQESFQTVEKAATKPGK